MTLSYDEWLDESDSFDPKNDPNPERNHAPPELMARILGISVRHLRRLGKAGVVEQQSDGQFHRMQTVDSYVAQKAAEPPAMSAGLRDRRAELMRRRLEREAKELISMPEALNTLDSVRGSFIDSIREVGCEAAKGRPKAEREHIAAVIASATDRLRTNFAQERKALRTGNRGEEE